MSNDTRSKGRIGAFIPASGLLHAYTPVPLASHTGRGRDSIASKGQPRMPGQISRGDVYSQAARIPLGRCGWHAALILLYQLKPRLIGLWPRSRASSRHLPPGIDIGRRDRVPCDSLRHGWSKLEEKGPPVRLRIPRAIRPGPRSGW